MIAITIARTLKPELAKAEMQLAILLASHLLFSVVTGQPLTTTSTKFFNPWIMNTIRP